MAFEDANNYMKKGALMRQVITSLIRHLRQQARTAADEESIQSCFGGIEKKHLPHILCLTNLLLHGIDVPSTIRHGNTPARPLRDWGAQERVDVIGTNLLFFTKGRPTTHVWYYEHPYPPGAKSYNKGKPIRIEEFEAERAWWGSERTGFAERVENERAWRVSLDQIKAGGFNLELKNPHAKDEGPGDVDHLLPEYEKLLAQIAETRDALKRQLMEALTR